MSNPSDTTNPVAAPLSPTEHAGTQGRFRLASTALFLLCLILFFWRLGSVPLFDLDEGLYVTCAREMALTGNIVTPQLNSHPSGRPQEITVPFYEKPILVYWASAGSMRLFGVQEWAARLPVALAALILTLLVCRAGTLWFGLRAGLLAAAVYASAPMTILDARQMTTDGLLVLWFSGTLLAFWSCYRSVCEGGGGATRSPLYAPSLFWVMAAAAVLTKGAVGLLLPSLVIGVFLALRFRSTGDVEEIRRTLKRLLRWDGIALFLALIVPWHVAIWRAGGHDANGRTFFQEYIIRQHIGRFRGGDKVHNAPLPTYLVYFLIGFFPWACFAPSAFLAGRRKGATEGGKPEVTSDGGNEKASPPAVERPEIGEETVRQFLLAWFWTIFVFFSLSAAKLPTYIVPAYPAAALLVGRWLDRAMADGNERLRSLHIGALAAFATAALLFAVGLIAPRFAPAGSPLPRELVRTVLLLVGTLAVGSGVAWLCFLGARRTPELKYAGFASYLLMILTFGGIAFTRGYALAEQEVMMPYQSLAIAARGDAAKGIPIVFYHVIPRRPSMLYYARYSPFEQRDPPLLPYLRALFSPPLREADVLMPHSILDQEVSAELERFPGATLRLLRQTGTGRAGWVLVRIRFAR